jgi:hypothetical protein
MGNHKSLTMDGAKDTCGGKTTAVGRVTSKQLQENADSLLVFHSIIHH